MGETSTDAAHGLPARAPRALAALIKADHVVQRAEVWLCAVCLLLIVVFAFLQVLLRTFRTDFFQPVAWFDLVARYLVIWVGMFGASLATGEGRHLALEALPRLMGHRGRRRCDVVISVWSLLVVSVLFALSLVYFFEVAVPDWTKHNNHLFVIDAISLRVPRWPFLVIVPIGLLITCWRFALRAVESLYLTDEEYQAREEALEREAMAGQAFQHPAEVVKLEDPPPEKPPEEKPPQEPKPPEAPKPAEGGAP